MPSPATLGTNPAVIDGVEVFDRPTTAKSVTSQESGSFPPPAATNRRGGANPAAAVAVTAEGAPMSDAGVAMGRSDSSGGGGVAAPGAAVESGAGTAGEEAVQRQGDRPVAVVRHKSKTKKEVGSPEPVYLQDIDFATAGGVATAADVLVKQARNRVRINRLKEGQAKGRHTEPDEKGDEKRLKLTIRMMLGVRVAVGRQSNPLDQPGAEISEEAFSQVDKYTFPPAGATGRMATPSHKLNKTFKFRDYAPKAFKKLRQHFGIEESAYMLSVAGNYDYLELITNSKSGSFFFYSHDQKYIIKAMKRAEAKFFRKILPKYYAHHLAHPGSFLIRFCGMYLVKNGHKKIPFIVMKCVEGDTNKAIHSKYDLKGSSLGRSAKEGEKVLKDNDLDVKYGKIHLGSQKAAFIEAAKADAEFLCSVNVMDYSMLTCIHDSSRPPDEEAVRRDSSEPRYSTFYTFADEAKDRTTPEFERIPSSGEASAPAGAAASREAQEGRGDAGAATGAGGDDTLRQNGAAQDRDEPSPVRPGGESVVRYRADGGVKSEVDGGAPGKDIYYLGIIDILQTFWKGLTHDRYEVSCVDPKLYYERFVDFLDHHTE
ncbi:unnamed protein product [Ectocarpus sp. 12 AP-2014]